MKVFIENSDKWIETDELKEVFDFRKAFDINVMFNNKSLYKTKKGSLIIGIGNWSSPKIYTIPTEEELNEYLQFKPENEL